MTQQDTNGKAEHPLKIFLSYGHPESEICKAIKAALEKRGHNVWMDNEQIVHGMDWRRKIATGLEESQGVVSCLSRHSVRDPGVCLDELSIAVGVKGGNIFTVLLEPEKLVNAPASVCHLQWLDMSAWQEKWGTPEWDEWFRIKMQQLTEEVESPESVHFAGQIEELRKRLLVDYSTSKQRSLLKQLFVGREWLTEEIEGWLEDENGAKLCVLYGDPGIGKSAFAAHYGHYNAAVAASLFLEFDHPHYTTVRSVTTTLAFLLACRIPDYRQALMTALEGVEIGSLGSEELFDKLIVEPAGYCIDGNRETLCIVIDGLDESAGPEQSALAEVLSNYVPRLPRWLRVLATSREVAAVQGPLAGAYHLTLHGREAQNLADVRAYFTAALAGQFGNDPAWPKALDALTERSDGIFLYAQLVADGLAKGKMGIGDVDAFPEGLSAAFHRWFTWFFPDIGEYRRRYRLPLAMILAAGQLPEQELRRVLKWREGEKDDFLQLISVLLTREADDFRQSSVRFAHQYLLDWLKNAPMTDLYRVSVADAVEAMAEAFYDIFRNDPKELTEFEALHLVGYLQESGMKKQAREAEMNHDLLRKILEAGDLCRTWGRLDRAMDCYQQAQAMAETMCRDRNAPEDRRMMSFCYNRAADIRKDKGDIIGAIELCEKCIDIDEQLVEERGTPEDRDNLNASYGNMVRICNAANICIPQVVMMNAMVPMVPYNNGLSILHRAIQHLAIQRKRNQEKKIRKRERQDYLPHDDIDALSRDGTTLNASQKKQTAKEVNRPEHFSDIDRLLSDKSSDSSRIQQIDTVSFSALTDAVVDLGHHYILKIMMYLKELQRGLIDEYIAASPKPLQETKAVFPAQVARGQQVMIRLTSEDVEISESEQTLTWTGNAQEFDFVYSVPEIFNHAEILIHANVYLDNVIATQLKILIPIRQAQCSLQITRQDVSRVFMSYSSEDRETVLAIVQGMHTIRPELDIFIDVEKLRSGAYWEQELPKEIDHCDVLYLCWSAFAKASTWVDFEWRYAYKIKGIDGVEPVPLQPPELCEPPLELKAKKHFNSLDMLVAFATHTIADMK